MSTIDRSTAPVNRGPIADISLESVPPPTMERDGHVIESGDVDMRMNVFWVSPDGRHATGVWEGQPGVLAGVFPFDENDLILKGAMTVTRPDGSESPITVKAGDSVFFPRGAEVRWTIHEPMRKLFSIYCEDGLPIG